MSSESKKKRGESGQANAKIIPFRNGGSRCDLSIKIGSTNHPRLGGSRFLNAMRLGLILPGFDPSDRALRAADECVDHCPTLSNETNSGKKIFKPVSEKTPRSSRPIIVFGAATNEIRLGDQVIDLSSASKFVGRGTVTRTKEMNRVSSVIIAAMQKDGFFQKENRNEG